MAPVKDAFVRIVANANIALTSQGQGNMVHRSSAVLNTDVLG